MGLVEQAIADNQAINSNTNDWAQSITMTAPTGEIAIVNGRHRKHHIQLDPATGAVIDSKNASVTINENEWIATNPLYPIRITDPTSQYYQEVDLKDHLINVADSTGIVKNYKALGWRPDETIGHIVIILEDYIAA